jgi:hypothetical protein
MDRFHNALEVSAASLAKVGSLNQNQPFGYCSSGVCSCPLAASVIATSTGKNGPTAIVANSVARPPALLPRSIPSEAA